MHAPPIWGGASPFYRFGWGDNFVHVSSEVRRARAAHMGRRFALFVDWVGWRFCSRLLRSQACTRRPHGAALRPFNFDALMGKRTK